MSGPTKIGAIADAVLERSIRSRDTKPPASETTDSAKLWPAPLGEKAKYGLAGDFVRLIAPHTEADEAALLLQFLVVFGSVVGRGPHCLAEGAPHFSNEFVGIVGRSSRSRKGSSLAHVKRRFQKLPPRQSGLSSGEGLIWAVRDATSGDDPGIADKRLLVEQSELASTLRVMDREGNTLSSVLRDFYDHGDAQIGTKNSPARATGAHVSMIGHITIEENRRYLTRTEMANGFANRFLWSCAKRARLLPDGGNLKEIDFGPFDRALAAAIDSAMELGIREFKRDDDANKLWHAEYGALTDDERTGILGAVTSRAEAHVLRLSLIYALLDGEVHFKIRRQHLEAALEVWRYADESARYIFGEATGDPDADKLMAALQRSGSLSRTVISSLFGRHQTSARIDSLLEGFRAKGLISCRKEQTGGAPVEYWDLISLNSLNSQPGGDS